MRRSEQRRDAAFAIYQQEVTGRPLEDLLADAKPFTKALAEGTFEHIPELDESISVYSRGWRLERIAPLEKAIMRVALYEISYREDVPTPVAIDEAVTITKKYCGAEAPGFVNGILSAASGGQGTIDPDSAPVDSDDEDDPDPSAFPEKNGAPDGTEAAA